LYQSFGGAALNEADYQCAIVTADNSFGRNLRLLKASDYKRVFERSTRITTRYLTLLARFNGLDYARLGLAISRKSAKRAVDRNRIKRHVRESFRCHQRELAGLDIVVMARAAPNEYDWRELRSSLDTKWRELRKRCKGC